MMFSSDLKAFRFTEYTTLKKEIQRVTAEYEIYLFSHQADDELYYITIAIPIQKNQTYEEPYGFDKEPKEMRNLDLCMYGRSLKSIFGNKLINPHHR